MRMQEILENQPKVTKKWFLENWEEEKFIIHYLNAIEDGFKFVNGLFLKFPFNEKLLDNVESTYAEIIFMRHSDLHVHPDMYEAISVIDGNGQYIKVPAQRSVDYLVKDLHSGEQFGVEPGTVHAFLTDLDSPLKIKVITDKIYTEKEEITRMPFFTLDRILKENPDLLNISATI